MTSCDIALRDPWPRAIPNILMQQAHDSRFSVKKSRHSSILRLLTLVMLDVYLVDEVYV